MSEFAPVQSMQDLNNLDGDEMVAGYLYGLDSDQEPGSDKSRSFWHGWRNAQVDRHRVPLDDAQRRLAHEYVGARAHGH